MDSGQQLHRDVNFYAMKPVSVLVVDIAHCDGDHFLAVFSFNQIGLFIWQSHILQSCRQLLMIESLFNNCQDWCPCSKNPSIETTHTLVEDMDLYRIRGLRLADVDRTLETFTLAQIIMFGWQTSIIQLLRNKAANSRLGPNLGVWVPNQSRWPGLLQRKPGEIYCLLCVIVQYNRILKGYTVQDDHEYKPKIVEEYVPRDGYFPEEKTKNLITYDEEYPPNKPPRYFAQIAPPQNQELTRAYKMRHSVRSDRHKPSQSPEFKTRFTEQWIKGMSENGKSEKPVFENEWQQDVKDDRANFYGKAKSLEALNMEAQQREGLRTCKSKDSVTSRCRRHCHHHHHHHHHSRKRKCRHKRSPNDVNDISSNDEDDDSSDNNNNNNQDHDYDTVCTGCPEA
uniref:Uncharacterized protein n=1 Tax=Romanomermis culicivorax TaxID=13658 RepID=A0A915JSV4_ROMCU